MCYREQAGADEDLTKLRGWSDKVQPRDSLGATGRESAVRALEQCGTTALDVFPATVYAADTDGEWISS